MRFPKHFRFTILICSVVANPKFFLIFQFFILIQAGYLIRLLFIVFDKKEKKIFHLYIYIYMYEYFFAFCLAENLAIFWYETDLRTNNNKTKTWTKIYLHVFESFQWTRSNEKRQDRQKEKNIVSVEIML